MTVIPTGRTPASKTKRRRATCLLMLIMTIGSTVITARAAPDTAAYARAAEYARERRGNALLIYHAGQLVYQEAQNGYDLERPHLLASGTKSFGCAIAVAMQQEGRVNLDERVSDTITEWQSDAQRRLITVRHLLNFTSGLTSDQGHQANFRARDLLREASTEPLVAAPGEVYTYGGLHLAVFAELVLRKTGTDAVTYLRQRVLNPIGARLPLFLRDARGLPALAGGALMTAPEWAKYGQLLLQQGSWNGRAILNADRLRDCFRGSAVMPAYGLTVWLNVSVPARLDARTVLPDGVSRAVAARASSSIAPGAPRNLIMLAGALNQRLYVLPDEQLVVVRFGSGGEWNDDEFLARLLGRSS